MGQGFGCGDESCIYDWHQRHVFRDFFCSLSSGILVYGAVVAAVAAMVSIVA